MSKRCTENADMQRKTLKDLQKVWRICALVYTEEKKGDLWQFKVFHLSDYSKRKKKSQALA